MYYFFHYPLIDLVGFGKLILLEYFVRVFVAYIRGSWLPASRVDVGIEHPVEFSIRVAIIDKGLFQVLDGSVEDAPIRRYFIGSNNECFYSFGLVTLRAFTFCIWVEACISWFRINSGSLGAAPLMFCCVRLRFSYGGLRRRNFLELNRQL